MFTVSGQRSFCICQTLHFMLREEIDHDLAVKLVDEEVVQYKAGLGRSRTKYKIVEETKQPDGSVMMKIIRQYNQSDVGKYLD